MSTNQREDSSSYLHGEGTAVKGVRPFLGESFNHNTGLIKETMRIFKRSEKSDFIGFSKKGWIIFFGDLLCIVLAHFAAVWIRFGNPINIFAFYKSVITITLFIYPVCLYVFDLYNTSRAFRSIETAYRLMLGVILGVGISIFIFYIFPSSEYGRGLMAIHMTILFIMLIGWRWFFGIIYQSSIIKTPALILGAGYSGKALYELLKSKASPYEIKGFVDDDCAKQGLSMSPRVLGACNQLEKIAKQVGATTAILAIPRNRPENLIRNMLYARLHGIEVQDTPNIFEKLTGRIPVKHIGDQWLLFADGFCLLHKEYIRKFKRLTDLIVSALVLVVTGPLLGLVALAIRLESPGPVMYTQERVGIGQKIFTIYKFRSMHHNAEAKGAKWAAENDPRVTRVGKLLRLTHIDELPQLWNIFNGDMSFVGPRPERPEFVKLLENEIPYYVIRHSIQPGLTGWAQINYQYGASTQDAMRKLEYDLYYIKNMSIFLDLKIILKTMGVVILRDGAR